MFSCGHVRLLAAPWTVAHQAPLCMELSRQEYWSGLPFPSPGDLPQSEMEPKSPELQADSLPLSHQKSPVGVAIYQAQNNPSKLCFVMLGFRLHPTVVPMCQ